ncbi:MAG TPA: TatD family hydrolase [Desulfomonilaceae bacterium]|nr:TatD family hydrolase [Desulfomonilaceae bacterium]
MKSHLMNGKSHDQRVAGGLIDSHAHLELEPLFKDSAAVVKRAREAGVISIITVGTDIPDVERALKIADEFERVFASVGFHPHNAKDVHDGMLAKMEILARHPKVVAYGEIGLDFFRNWSPQEVQVSVFEEQLELAKRLTKPVVIHLRNAHKEGLEILEKAAPFAAGGVIHCFSGDRSDAQRALELGFYISIPGTVTYKKNERLRAIIRELPEDRLLLETDAPFLTPEPFRGKDNEPAFIVHTAAKVAEVRGTSIQEISSATASNAIRLFQLPLEQCEFVP